MEAVKSSTSLRPLLFLSYRQKLTGPEVRAFKTAKQSRFPGADIFMDGDAIAGGGPLSDQVWAKLEQTSVFIAFFGPKWASVYRQRHQASPGSTVSDWPADELEWALHHKPEATHCVSTGHEEHDDTYNQRRAEVLEVWEGPFYDRLADRRWRPLYVVAEHQTSIDAILDDVSDSLRRQGLYEAATAMDNEPADEAESLPVLGYIAHRTRAAIVLVLLAAAIWGLWKFTDGFGTQSKQGGQTSEQGVYRVYDESSGYYNVFRMPSNEQIYSYKPARKVHPLSDERLRTFMRSELSVDEETGAVWISIQFVRLFEKSRGVAS